LNYCGLEKSSIEMIHLPGADAVELGELVDVIEWSYEHKDEKFSTPIATPELDMGKRIFKYVSGLVNKKK
jgi:hypothetical protein